MESGFSILMFIFAGAILLYAAVMAITKNYNMLPYRSRVSVRPKNPERYMVQLSRIVALTGLAIAAGAAVALWNQMAGAIVMIIGVIASLWAGTKIIKKAG
ncbi:MAG: hypothetical protein IJ088_14580 [Clostridia bacterium]|nr:hypothetical protein [Clostridia bacterium]